MKKILAFIFLPILVLGNFARVAASEPKNTTFYGEINAPAEVGEGDNASLSFAQLGFRQTELTSPFDVTHLLFSIPPNWKLAAGGDIQIDYDVMLSGSGLAQLASSGNPYGGSLTVSFNNQVIGTISLSATGSNSARFQIPQEALSPATADGRHVLKIALDAQFSCQYDVRATVTIKNTSILNLVYGITPPDLNLSRLPAPFYTSNALVPERTLVVTPDSPTPGELQAALNIMAGFGSMVGSTADFSLVNSGKVTNDDLATSNFIFVGEPDKLPLLSNVITLPLKVEAGNFPNLPPDSASDGVVQMAVSPWNAAKSILLVSGKSEDAVQKASQAVSSGNIFIYQDPTLAYVKEVQPSMNSIPLVENFSVQNLGYPTETLNGLGVSSVDYTFMVAKQQLFTRDGYFELFYYHSALVDNGLSSLNIELNGQVINSTALDKASEELTSVRIKIPFGILRYGENRLTISTRLAADTSCDESGFSDPWAIISDQSNFHLPEANTLGAFQYTAMDLKNYPGLFVTQSDLGDLAFVLSKTDSTGWGIAGKLAYELGRVANPAISGIKAVYADDVSPEIRENYSMIVIGKASTLPIMNELNDSLPAPFDFATDTASERQLQIVYRIPQGVSVGYLELFHSPFNIDKLIMVLSGNDAAGLVLSGDALLVNEINSQVSGVFAITNGKQVAVGDDQAIFSTVGDVVPNADAVVTTPLPSGTNPALNTAPPSWLMPFLMTTGGIILIIIAFVAKNAFSRKRKASVDLPRDGEESEAEETGSDEEKPE
ncbi:MAG: cellulose biosynthesis cyclic di-GMP-binding regulatory protein BcsB [Anaerolineales bacterium]|nr:cellulose biosynthesis cyclic di-GMP-binding regulatory protein BcsB [Anaerolineales bacterium]